MFDAVASVVLSGHHVGMIRWASAADATGVARVHVDTWEGTYRGLMPDEVLHRRTLDRAVAGWAVGGSTTPPGPMTPSELGSTRPLPHRTVVLTLRANTRST